MPGVLCKPLLQPAPLSLNLSRQRVEVPDRFTGAQGAVLEVQMLQLAMQVRGDTQVPAATDVLENRAESAKAELALRAAVVEHAVSHKTDDLGAAIHDDDKVVKGVGLEQTGVAIPEGTLPAVRQLQARGSPAGSPEQIAVTGGVARVEQHLAMGQVVEADRQINREAAGGVCRGLAPLQVAGQRSDRPSQPPTARTAP